MFWNRGQAIEEQRKADIVDRLLKGPIGQKLKTEIDEDRRAERQQLIDEIAKAQALIERDGPGLQQALREAEAEIERAERIAAAARAKRTMAVNAIASFSSRTERATIKAQAKLRESADPGIEDLVLEIERNHNAFRNRVAVELRVGSEPDPEATGPDQRNQVYVSRSAAISEKMRILEALRDETAALALNHAGDPSERLNDIRKRMPTVDAALPVEHYVEQRPRMVRAR